MMKAFFHTGDAVRLVDINDPTKGLMYDGRIAEDFKLNTGTFCECGHTTQQSAYSR